MVEFITKALLRGDGWMKKTAGILAVLMFVMPMVATTGCLQQKCPQGKCTEEESPKLAE